LSSSLGLSEREEEEEEDEVEEEEVGLGTPTKKGGREEGGSKGGREGET